MSMRIEIAFTCDGSGCKATGTGSGVLGRPTNKHGDYKSHYAFRESDICIPERWGERGYSCGYNFSVGTFCEECKR